MRASMLPALLGLLAVPLAPAVPLTPAAGGPRPQRIAAVQRPGAPGPVMAGAGTLRLAVSPRHAAEVRFRVDAPLDFIPGLSRGVSGWAELDPSALENSRARVEVDLHSFDTGIDLRNEDLRDQFFEADRYPVAVLQVRSLARASAPALATGREVHAEAVATLSLHGLERELRFPVTLRLLSGEAPAVAVSGGFGVALEGFRIQRPSRLLLKVGKTAVVTFHATFAAPPPGETPPAAGQALVAASVPGTVAAANAADRRSAPAATLPARGAELPRRTVAFLPLGRHPASGARPQPVFHFPFDTPEGRGERLFHDATLGGPGNAVACAHCHTTADERWGLALDGQVRSSRSLYGAAARPALWQGMAANVGKAASVCAKWFMLRPDGLEASRESDLSAFLGRMSPDPAPGLDYRILALTRRSALPRPLGGDAKRGRVLEQKFCGGCHAEKGLRSPLTPGLYEAEDLVRRVRWLPGTDARQMPPIYVDRLPDSDLRDIVTYLAGDPSQRIFRRRGR